MSASRPVAGDVAAMTYRILDTIEVLDTAVSSGDLLTARYAAATLSELADAIERTLIAATGATGSLRLVPVT